MGQNAKASTKSETWKDLWIQAQNSGAGEALGHQQHASALQRRSHLLSQEVFWGPYQPIWDIPQSQPPSQAWVTGAWEASREVRKASVD